MRDINDIDLRLVDSTILMVFLGIMRHRQATAVAREMGLTQPAVSHALKRLRALYDDPLFLRRAHGLEPTAFALELEPKIRQIIRLISETLAEQEAFDPKETAASLRIGAFDYELATVLADMVAEMQESSPNFGIHTYPYTNRAALDALIDGRIDLAIGYFDFPFRHEESFVTDNLCTEHYVVAARRGHSLMDREATLKDVAEAKHLTISPTGPEKTMVDHAMQLRGTTRSILSTVPSLYAALAIIENTDLVATLPSRVAKRNVERFNITYRPLPIDGGTFQLSAVRHLRDAKSPLHTWVVERLQNLMREDAE